VFLVSLQKNVAAHFLATIALDKRSRILEVVVVRRYSPRCWEFGVGREWGRVEKGEVSLPVT
jgi:hypothetical protein